MQCLSQSCLSLWVSLGRDRIKTSMSRSLEQTSFLFDLINTESCNLLLMNWWHFNDWLHFLLVVSLLGKCKERPCYVHWATESHVLSDNQWSILTFGWHFSHLVQSEVAMLKEHSAVWMTVLSYLNRNRAGVHKKCATRKILIHFSLLKSLDRQQGP